MKFSLFHLPRIRDFSLEKKMQAYCCPLRKKKIKNKLAFFFQRRCKSYIKMEIRYYADYNHSYFLEAPVEDIQGSMTQGKCGE